MPEPQSLISVRALHLATDGDRRRELRALGIEDSAVPRLTPCLDVPALRLEGLEAAHLGALEALGLPIRLILSPSGNVALLLASAADLRTLAASADPGLRPVTTAIARHLDRRIDTLRPFQCVSHTLRLDLRTHLVGILNVTPDSFSDGGCYFRTDDALRQADRMLEEGADVLDVGGESSRPAGPYGDGAQPVSEEEEIRRTAPVIEAVVRRFGAVVSIDTTKAGVAEAAVDAGASLVNDITALRGDPRMAEFVARAGVPVSLMHMQGSPGTMQKNPVYADLLREVYHFLAERVRVACEAGIPRDRILVDPGIGFGKTREHNYALLRRLSEFQGLGCPVLVGTSRKGFLGAGFDLPPSERLEGTLASHALCVAGGAGLLRVHDVAAARKAVRVADSTLRETAAPAPEIET